MNQWSKKIVGFALAAAMTTGLLAGCTSKPASTGEAGTSGSQASTANAAPSSGVTLTFGSHQSGLPTSGVVQEIAKDFEAETGIKIDFQISPDAQWRDLIKVKMDSGEAPDIICVDTPIALVSSIQMHQYSVPLTDQEWVSRMDENVLPAVSKDGEVYGISFAGKKMYFYVYNTDLFDELGLKAPTSYKEFKEVCQAIKDAGTTPIYEATVNGWHQVLPLFETGGLWQQNHKDIYERLNKNEVGLDEVPELLTVLQQLKECADLGYFGEDYLSNSVENAKEAIATGQCAMYISEAGFKDEVKTDFGDSAPNLGIFVMPWADNQVIGVNPASNAYFINKDSKHVEEAKQFFDFLARPENLQKRLDGQTGLKELCWPEIPGRYTEEEKAYIDSHEKNLVVQVGVNYIDSQWMDVGKDLENMYMGAATPEDVLKTIIDRRDEQARLQKDPAWS